MMVLPTAERTTQIPPTGVSGMCEKADPALGTMGNAAQKLRMGLEDRVQRRLILPDNRLGTVMLMPIRMKRKKLLGGYGKKARFSVIIVIVLCTPSSYLLDANVSRGRARFFLRKGQQFAGAAPAHGQGAYHSHGLLRVRFKITTWKEESLLLSK